MWLMMIFCEHSWPLLRCLWKRIYSPLITGVFAHQSNIFAPTFLRNNQRWCKKSASHLYSSSMSLWSTSGFCYLRPQRRIPAILKRKCDVKLDRTMRQAWHSWAQLSIEHVCQKFWFSQNVTRCSCVSMKIGVFTFPRGPGYWGLFIICG